MIFTDLAVIRVEPAGLLLLEVAPGWSAEAVLARTEAPLRISPDLREITL
jgi:acyl CoA:acetate/3-ketoacid CoA transferase beta subunit